MTKIEEYMEALSDKLEIQIMIYGHNGIPERRCSDMPTLSTYEISQEGNFYRIDFPDGSGLLLPGALTVNEVMDIAKSFTKRGKNK